ncbi:alpha/beta hydrolase [Streptomyces cocklensis]|uniref:Alpha/beta hydrolase n=1 Tax=Actinacidiphila cocklensis TaxID=887465 RepID=A0A9W4E7Q4_9ACTN|nr:alpha/beta hydrolase [Actinacidiphila cocklensis]MDD1063536.1 alpha/beta hydrolase [Actinacidiphila cocklensis]CAG6394733.1 Alpha/beta hydrolase [Actinacidiphila cocklensis]
MSTSTPTVVLVHGAFADASSWSGVIAALQSDGISVVAPANPLRGLASDAAYLASVAAQIDGPVVLVGHSYGGALITVAGMTENVVGLVYVAAYVLEEGESMGGLQGDFPDTPLVSSLKQWHYPVAGGDPAVELTLVPEAFPSVFAADVPLDVAKWMAVSQRPLAGSVFTETASAAAWKTKPSWALVAGSDRGIDPEVQRFAAKRAGAAVVEIEAASHAVALSHPKAVADLIREAVRATS